jgi:hypothetical protein
MSRLLKPGPSGITTEGTQVGGGGRRPLFGDPHANASGVIKVLAGLGHGAEIGGRSLTGVDGRNS